MGFGSRMLEMSSPFASYGIAWDDDLEPRGVCEEPVEALAVCGAAARARAVEDAESHWDAYSSAGHVGCLGELV